MRVRSKQALAVAKVCEETLWSRQSSRPSSMTTASVSLRPRVLPRCLMTSMTVWTNLDLSEAYVKDDARVARTVSIA